MSAEMLLFKRMERVLLPILLRMFMGKSRSFLFPIDLSLTLPGNSNVDGGKAIRMINPCDDDSCWFPLFAFSFLVPRLTLSLMDQVNGPTMSMLCLFLAGILRKLLSILSNTLRRCSLSRFNSVETLPDGSAIIIGGELFGSFVNAPGGLQNVPSAEFWPRRSPDDVPFNITFLELTMPVNLYPLTWLLSNGQLFMQVSQPGFSLIKVAH